MSSSFQSRLREWKIDRRRFLYSTAGLPVSSPRAACRRSRRRRRHRSRATRSPSGWHPAIHGPTASCWTRLAPEPLAADGHGGVRSGPRSRSLGRGIRRRDAPRRPARHHVCGPGLRALRPRDCRWAVARSVVLVSVQRRGEWSPVGRTRTRSLSGSRHDSSALRLPRASISRRATSPRTSTWRTRTRPGCSSAITSMRTGVRRRFRAAQRRRAMTVAAYRNRYALYKRDPEFQATHAAFPWLVVVGRSRSGEQLGRDKLEERLGAGAFLRAARPHFSRTTSTCRCAGVDAARTGHPAVSPNAVR